MWFREVQKTTSSIAALDSSGCLINFLLFKQFYAKKRASPDEQKIHLRSFFFGFVLFCFNLPRPSRCWQPFVLVATALSSLTSKFFLFVGDATQNKNEETFAEKNEEGVPRPS